MTERHLGWSGAPGELQSFGPRFTARVQLLDSVFRRQRPERALDIGCGRGAITRVLARRANRVVAVEVSNEAVQAAAESLADIDNVEVHLSNLFANTGEQPPFSGQHFNLVLLSEVLEHLEDDIGALRRIRQLLEDVGVLVITVPRDPALWSLEDELWGHKRRYLRGDLIAKLEAAGFRTSTVWTWGFPLTRYLVLLQVWRLKRRSRANQDAWYDPIRLPHPLLHLARLAFTFIATFERLFKRIDRGIGYIVVAEPMSDDVSFGKS
jgi:SAM-dependent methyltransferase